MQSDICFPRHLPPPAKTSLQKPTSGLCYVRYSGQMYTMVIFLGGGRCLVEGKCPGVTSV